MFFEQTASFCFRWLVLWLALSTVEGKDSSLFQREEKRDVSVELTKTDNEPVDDYNEFPAGCIARKMAKRSTSFGLSQLRGTDSQETNCQIVPVTTTIPPVTKAQTTTKEMKKIIHTIETESSEDRSRILYFLPYFPRPSHTVFNVIFPFNKGTIGYNTIWNNKILRDDSSEEKRRKRDTLMVKKKSKTSMKYDFKHPDGKDWFLCKHAGYIQCLLGSTAA